MKSIVLTFGMRCNRDRTSWNCKRFLKKRKKEHSDTLAMKLTKGIYYVCSSIAVLFVTYATMLALITINKEVIEVSPSLDSWICETSYVGPM